MNKAKIMMALTSLLSLLVASGAFFKLLRRQKPFFSREAADWLPPLFILSKPGGERIWSD